MNAFKEREFLEICRKLGVAPNCREVSINYNSAGYFNKIREAVRVDRRGEVVFCVIRPNGKIITVTCEEYPEGIFRIPTGGIGHNEDIVRAVYREVKEELGLDVVIENFAGVLKIKFEHKEESVMFYSYLFVLKEISGKLLEDASDDEVSAVREVTVEGLFEVIEALKDIPGKWNDWGRFRYETSRAIYDFLKFQATE